MANYLYITDTLDSIKDTMADIVREYLTDIGFMGPESYGNIEDDDSNYYYQEDAYDDLFPEVLDYVIDNSDCYNDDCGIVKQIIRALLPSVLKDCIAGFYTMYESKRRRIKGRRMSESCSRVLGRRKKNKVEEALRNLNPVYDSRSSFYNKAKVYDNGNIVELYSYDTLVSKYDKNTGEVEHLGKYSPTTSRHQREFEKQCKAGYFD